MKSWTLKRTDLMTVDEWKTFRAYLNQSVETKNTWTAFQDRAICLLAAWTGLRRSELAALKQGDMYLERSQPFCVVQNGKGGRRGEVLLIPAAAAMITKFLLRQHMEGFPMGDDMPLFRPQRGDVYTGNGIYRVWTTALANAGLPVRSIHKARHLYAMTLYKQSGFNLRLVKEQLRHTKITTTEIYTTVTDEAAGLALAEAEKVLA